MPFLPQNRTQFLNSSWLWVDFFFILSGFIMCYAYSKHFIDGVNKANYKKYLGARFARVYPLHFVTTMWMFVCSLLLIHFNGHGDEIINPKALPATLLLIQSMHISFKVPPLNTPSWSLSTEWWVYLLFPFCLPFFIRIKNKGKILVTVGLVVFYIFIRNIIGPISNGHPGPTLDVTTDFGFLRCLAGFFTGMLLFTLYEQRLGYHLIVFL
jgi:peptidoglycan/LPS O-acetylase OafA/YrhL